MATRKLLAIDLGAESASVVVSSTGGVWFRTFGLGGDHLIRGLARDLQLTHDEAEQVLREPARARRFFRYREALSPLFVQLGSEILRSLAGYHKLLGDLPARRIYGLGGAFSTLGLLKYLRTGK